MERQVCKPIYAWSLDWWLVNIGYDQKSWPIQTAIATDRREAENACQLDKSQSQACHYNALIEADRPTQASDSRREGKPLRRPFDVPEMFLVSDIRPQVDDHGRETLCR